MKMVTAVLASSAWPEVFDALKVIDVDGLTLTELAGRRADSSRGLRVEIVTADEQADEVAATILHAGPLDQAGNLRLWISAVDGYVPVRPRREDF